MISLRIRIINICCVNIREETSLLEVNGTQGLMFVCELRRNASFLSSYKHILESTHGGGGDGHWPPNTAVHLHYRPSQHCRSPDPSASHLLALLLLEAWSGGTRLNTYFL